MRINGRAEQAVRAASMLVTVITLASLADIFADSLFSCLLLVWKHTVGHIDVPFFTEEESVLSGQISLAIAIVLGLVDKREVQIIHFMNAYAFSSVQNAERQAVFGGLILINLKGDFSQLR